MRPRVLLALVLAIVSGVAILPASMALASPQSVVFAQDEGTDTEQGEGGDTGGEGQDDPEAETDPGAGEDAAIEEEGPPWTYQMARISIGLILLLAAGMALLYRRLIGGRQKTGA